MSKRQFFGGIILAALLGGAVAVGLLTYLDDTPAQRYANLPSADNVAFSNFLADTTFAIPDGINFIYAAQRARPGVVFIRSTYRGQRGSRYDLLEEFYDYFGDRDGEERNPHQGQPSRSSGSGVLISEDGYIVTNNHVIEDASTIEVTLNDNRLYEAELVGTDPTTDLALLKIDDTNLSYVPFGDSDNIQVGEWVLAVGNPFGTLTSTVTAGIVSAKARNINILHDQNNQQIEAFIQTDAAVNRGNSGGALVNLRGELVGINTAIATQTGSYAGYSFAVPATLVQKVMGDLLEFGSVQRALLGVAILDVNANLAREKGLDVVTGVFIDGVAGGSAAAEAGIEPGDVIVEINKQRIRNIAQLQELVARNRPGDGVKVTYWRDGQLAEVEAVLKGTMGSAKLMREPPVSTLEGSVFVDPPAEVLEELDIEGGALLTKLGKGKWKEAGLQEGFVVTAIDRDQVKNAQQLAEVMAQKQGGILIEGYKRDGSKAFYGYGW
jgi:Do/DeqQ family serine protease